jgi:hypothetical protein
MNNDQTPQGQNSLWHTWLVTIMKHKNLALAGVFVFFVVGFFAITSLNANSAQAAISYVGGRGGSAAGANSGTITVTLSSGLTGGSGSAVAAGDLVIVTVSIGTAARQPALSPSGYTALTAQRTTATAFDANVQTSYKFMPSTPDASLAIANSGSTADGIAYTVQVFRGVDPTTPLDGVTPTYATGSGTNNLPNPATITPATSGAWIYFGGGGANGATSATYAAGYLTNFLTFMGADTNAGTVGSGYYSAWVSGAYDGAVWTGGAANAGNSWGSTTLVLRPIPSITVSGTCQGYDQSTACVNGVGTVKVAVNGVVNSASAATFSSGAWSFTILAPASGASVIVFLDGAADADEATAVTLYDGSGDITNVRLYKQQVTIGTDSGSANSGQTITLANMDDYDVTNDEDIFYDANLSGGTCNGVGPFTGLCIDANTTSGSSSQEKLHILNLAGNNFAPAGHIVTHDLNIESSGSFTGAGHIYNVSGSWNNTGTFTPSTSFVEFSATSTGETITTTGSAFNNLSFTGSGGGWSFSDASIINGNFNMTAGTLSGTSNITVKGSVACGATCGTITITGGTFTQNVASGSNFGTSLAESTAWTFNNLTFSSSTGTPTITVNSTGTGTITVTGALIISTNTILNAGNRTLVLSNTGGLGNPFVVDGTFTASTSTVNYTYTVSNFIAPVTYYNLGIGTANDGSTATFTLNGNTTVTHVLSIGNASASTYDVLDLSTYTLTLSGNGTPISMTAGKGRLTASTGIVKYTSTTGVTALSTMAMTAANSSAFYDLTIDGDGGGDTFTSGVDIDVSNNLTISAGDIFTAPSALTIGGDLTNSGTFTHNSGTVTFNNASLTSDITGSNTFYNFSVSTAGKTVRFTQGTTTTIASGGSINVTGGSGNNVIFTSVSGAATWTINHNAAASESITYLTVNWGACHVSSSTITMGTGSTKDGNSDACWEVPVSGLTFSGVLYLSDSSTADPTSRTLRWSKGGAASSTITTDVTTGVWTFSSAATAGDVFTIWIDGGSLFGTTVLKYGTNCASTPNCSGIKVVRNQVRLYSKNATSITYDTLNDCDADVGAGCATSNVGFNVNNSTNAITINDGMELYITGGFDGGGATFAPGASLTTSPSADGNDSNQDGDILISIFEGGGGTLDMGSNALSVGGDLVVVGGFTKSAGQTTTFTATATGHQAGDCFSNYENVVFNGSGGGWEFVSNCSGTEVIVNGDITVTAGTLSGSSFNVTVNGGDVTGAGGINFTGGNFTVSGAGSFGSSAAWTFQVLTLSGSSTTTATGAGGITVNSNLTIDTGHILNAGSQIWNLFGSTPFTVSGTFNEDTSTVNFSTGSNITVTADTYYKLNIGTVVPQFQGDEPITYTLGGNTTVTNVLTIGNAGMFNAHTLALNNYTLTLSGSGTPLVVNSMGGFNAGTGTVTYTSTTGVTALSSIAMTSSYAFNNLIIDGDGGGDTFTAGISIDVAGDFTVSAGDIFASANNVTVNGVVGGTGTISHTAGTFTHSTTTSKSFGSATNWSFNNLTFSGTSGISASSGTSNITVAGTLNVGLAHNLAAGDKTWILTASGTPFNKQGGLDVNTGTSTFSYRNTTSATVTTTTYDNLDFAPASGTPTYTLSSGSLTLNNNFTIDTGAAATVTVTAATSDPTIDFNGNVSIGASDTFVASDANDMTVAGNWTNLGTFTHQTGRTVTFDAGSTGKTIDARSTNGKFANITFNNASGGWTVTNTDLNVTGVLTITNGNLNGGTARTITLEGNLTPFVKTGGTFTQGTSTVKYMGDSGANILALNGSGTTDAYYNLTIGGFTNAEAVTYTMTGDTTVNNVLKIGDSGATDIVILNAGGTLTLKGSSTPMDIATGGKGTFAAGTGTVAYTSGSGVAALSTLAMTSGNAFYNLVINGTGTFTAGGAFDAATLTVTSGTLAIADNVTLGGNVTGNGTINHTSGTFTLMGGLGSNFGGDTAWNFNNLTFGEGNSTATGTGTITIGGTLTISADSTLDAGSKTWTLSGTGTPFVKTGTFTPSTSTVDYTGGGGTFTSIAAATYHNLGLKPGANSSTHALDGGTFIIGGTLTIGAGTGTSRVVTANTNNPIIDLNGTSTSIDIKASTTFVAPPSASFTVAGSWANAGTFTHNSGTVTFDATSTGKTIQSNSSQWNNVIFNGSGGGWTPSDAMVLAGDMSLMTTGTLSGTQNITVNGGDVTGSSAFTINLTGGTFLVDGTGNFGGGLGTSGGNSASFNNLTFGDGTGISTTTFTISPVIAISGVLTIAANQTVNDATASAVTLSGAGTPFVINGTYSNSGFGNVLKYTSATGVTALANTALTDTKAPYELRIIGTGTFTAGVALEARNALEVQSGTLAMGANNLTVGSTALASSGRLRISSGQSITQDATASTTILAASGTSCIGSSGSTCTGTQGTISLGDLIIGNGSNTFTATLGATTPTLGVDTLTINGSATFNAGTGSTINITGNGTVFTPTGTFNAQTSAMNFNSALTSGTTIPAAIYNNVAFNKASNTFTAGGAITANNMVISNGTFVAPSGNLTINGNFTNNGAFTHNSGTVVIAPVSANSLTSAIGGSSNTTFNTLTNTTANSSIQFANGRTYQITTLTATGTSGKPVKLVSDSLGVRWLIDMEGTATLTYVAVRDAGCSSSADINTQSKVFDLGNNDISCWKFIKRGAGNGGSEGGPGSGGSGSGGGGAGGSTSQARATATVSGGAVQSVQIVSGGAGYFVVPLVCFVDAVSSNEAGGAGTAVISGGAVTSITVNSGGTGYTSNTTVVIGAPGTSGGTCASGSGGGGGGGGGGGSP